VATAKGPPPLLERLGSSFLQSSAEAAAVADDPIHVLNPVERAGLQRVVRGAVFRAALAGILNAVATGVSGLYAARLLGGALELASLSQKAAYFGAFGALAVLFAMAEVVFLYWDGLRAVRRLSAVAGLELGTAENEVVALALARAALELPNPPEATFGVNPHREASHAQLVVASIVYKLKITATNFAFKAIVEHALGRLATRLVLAFTAIPVNAVWNGLVCWSVLREARIRVMGPSAAVEMLEVILEGEPEPKPALVAVIHQAVGSAVVRSSELHPNHIAVLRAVRERLGEPSPGLVLDDSLAFLKALSELDVAEQRVAIRVLALAAILDGRLVRGERRLLSEAYAAAELEPGSAHVEKLLRAFVAGDVIPREELRRSA
jgi:hypothetical protein